MKRMTQQDPTVSARQIADPRRGVSQHHVVGHAARAVGPVVTPPLRLVPRRAGATARGPPLPPGGDVPVTRGSRRTAQAASRYFQILAT